MRKENINKNKKRKKFSWKMFLGFMAFQIFFGIVTAPFILLYGPFENAKKTFVSSAMGSMHYQWLATTLLSQEKIDDILGKNDEIKVDFAAPDTSLINIANKNSTNVNKMVIQGENYRGYVLEVADPTRVHVGTSSKLDINEGEKTSKIAKNYNAVAAINGGQFTDDPEAEEWTQNGGLPQGIIISFGEEIFAGVNPDVDYLDVAAINSQGRLIVGKYTLNQLREMDIQEALNFGPTLIYNGEKVPFVDTVGNAPKTLIGQKADGTMVLVAIDSKTGSRATVTLEEAQQIMYDLGCINATNLDGGKSTTMYYNGEVINNPSFATGERKISAGFVVK